MCEPAQSKRMSTCHKRHHKSHCFTEILQEKCRGPNGAQNADAHFVRACTVEIHVHRSQETSEEPLIQKFTGKCCGPDWAQNADTHFVRACAVETHVHRHKSHQKSAHFVRDCAVERMSRFHKSHFIRKFTGKLPRPRVTTLIKLRPLLRP